MTKNSNFQDENMSAKADACKPHQAVPFTHGAVQSFNSMERMLFKTLHIHRGGGREEIKHPPLQCLSLENVKF